MKRGHYDAMHVYFGVENYSNFGDHSHLVCC